MEKMGTASFAAQRVVSQLIGACANLPPCSISSSDLPEEKEDMYFSGEPSQGKRHSFHSPSYTLL